MPQVIYASKSQSVFTQKYPNIASRITVEAYLFEYLENVSFYSQFNVKRVLLMLTTVPGVRFTTTLAGFDIDLMLQGTNCWKYNSK